MKLLVLLIPFVVVTTATWDDAAYGPNKAGGSKGFAESYMTSRIVGGTNAAQNEFPFMVSWYWNFEDPPGCGGSLVAPNLVLTAAHCNVIRGTRVLINNGYTVPNLGVRGVEQRRIMKRIPHPQYDDDSLFYDFLLLELDDDVTSIEPIELNLNDPNQPQTDTLLTVIGFGLTSHQGRSSRQLKKVDVRAYSPGRCRSIFGSSLVRDDITLCAGLDEGGKDACAGDSGGPIFQRQQSNGKVLQVGVVSWGYGCAQARYPGVYSRVSGVGDWLQQEICSRSSNPKPSYCPQPVPTPPPTNRPTAPPTRKPTQTPTTSAPIPLTTPEPTITTRNPTPEPTTALPTLQPTPAPTLPQCKVCTDFEPLWMVYQDEACTNSPDTLARLCNQNDHWIRNRLCEYSCYLAGLAYTSEGLDCCVADDETFAPTPSPIIVVDNSILDIVFFYVENSPPGCQICTDIGNDWMIDVGNSCPNSYLLETKCNRSRGWVSAKYCQLSCYRAGLGYDGDLRCDTATPTDTNTVSPTISPTTANPTISPTTLSPTTAIPTMSPTTRAPVVPTESPTTPSPKTSRPTAAPTTAAPTTLAPTTATTTSLAPTTAAPTTIVVMNCMECTDIGNSWMQNQNENCHVNHILIQRKCNRNEVWKREKNCQYTCYITGYGYDGDVCCLKEESSSNTKITTTKDENAI